MFLLCCMSVVCGIRWFNGQQETCLCVRKRAGLYYNPEAEEIMCLYPVWLWVNTVLAYQIIQGTGVCLCALCVCVCVVSVHTNKSMFECIVWDEKQAQQWLNCLPHISPIWAWCLSAALFACVSHRVWQVQVVKLVWGSGGGGFCQPTLTPYVSCSSSPC